MFPEEHHDLVEFESGLNHPSRPDVTRATQLEKADLNQLSEMKKKLGVLQTILQTSETKTHLG